MSSAWTDSLKTEVIAQYVEVMTKDYTTDAERSANSSQVLETIVNKLKDGEMPGATVNGVRMILVKAGVFHKKSAATAGEKSTSTGGADKATGAKRVSKADAHQELINLINTIDAALVDEEVITKLTGKAAQYVSSILVKVL